MVAVPSIGRATLVEAPRRAPGVVTTEGLYERHAGKILAYCRHQLGSREEAEDAVQTTFMNAFRALEKGIVPESETAWLYKIAENVCLSRRRSSWRRNRIESPSDFDVIEEIVPGPSGRRDELIGIEDALASMPEQQRRAILLREWQGLSYREIAAELQLSQAAVETLIFRARRSLAQGLEQPELVKAGSSKRTKLRRALHAADLGTLVASLKTLGTALFTAKATATAVTVAVAAGAAATVGPKMVEPHVRPQAPKPAAATPAPSAKVQAPTPVASEHSTPAAVVAVSPDVRPAAVAPEPVAPEPIARSSHSRAAAPRLRGHRDVQAGGLSLTGTVGVVAAEHAAGAALPASAPSGSPPPAAPQPTSPPVVAQAPAQPDSQVGAPQPAAPAAKPEPRKPESAEPKFEKPAKTEPVKPEKGKTDEQTSPSGPKSITQSPRDGSGSDSRTTSSNTSPQLPAAAPSDARQVENGQDARAAGQERKQDAKEGRREERERRRDERADRSRPAPPPASAAPVTTVEGTTPAVTTTTTTAATTTTTDPAVTAAAVPQAPPAPENREPRREHLKGRKG